MNEDKFEIRSLDVTDWEAFRQIRLQAISDAPSAIWPTRDEESGRTLEEVQARIKMTATQVVFGAFSEQKLAGIAGLRREPLAQVAHKAVLWGVYVNPAQRKQGIARQLFAEILAHARQEQVLQIQLCVNAENVKAKNLYRSLGFKSYGLEPRAMRVGDRFYDEEHMVLRLDD